MTIKPYDIAKVLVQMTADGKTPDAVAKSFATFVKTYDRQDLVAPVIKALSQIVERDQQTDTLVITTAKEASPKIIKQIRTYIGQDKTEVETQVDPELWGGWQALYKNELHDASIANKIKAIFATKQASSKAARFTRPLPQQAAEHNNLIL